MSEGKPLTRAEGEQLEGRLEDFNDGSPSTVGIGGLYNGGVSEGEPNGFGTMKWDNGITYKGVFRNGKYHGHGRKLYSRGGGYEGNWKEGKREGFGISFFNEESLGRHGILRWEVSAF